MASVKDYLKKLLYQYDCVVVPELGAFLTHYQPASFTEASGLYLPPRKRVAFNEALRLDDGILANYIMLHEPFTREGAQRYISLFVSNLYQQIQQAGRFEIDGIGTFSHNDEGRLQFDPSLRHNFFGEAYGMNAITAKALVADPVEAVVVAPSTLGPVLVPESETTLVPLRRSRPYWRIAAAALLVGSLGLVSYFSVIRPDQPFQSSLDPANLLRIPADFFSTPAKLSVTEAPKPVAAVRSTPTAPVVSTEKPAVVKAVPAPVAPVVTPKPADVATGTPASVNNKLIKIAPAETHFTVIAGSFSKKGNALRLKRQLRKAGYQDAYVIIPSQKGQLYKVAATGSTIREDVVARMAAIDELAGTESWILKN